ncbi:TetR/AcrR family transcriptional regulator [Spiractinospora alimapuensis]|uniref:TetR/AcrR family transcriptional regulator n=1 Tax=Spiractinospora alimapuensis TaxID=2820884 RepID=UPI001F17E201|nr:TetR/AcrR family transcriptional regulator [Spiractinospora alimapuensis]QVQ50319.1 TetR/AcrR family transcriptional regulator [Spiractinospora alimapuensis]
MDVLDDLVNAALRAARDRGQDVAMVPLPAIAAEAGVSRSTLLRRLGGSRAALDDAVRRAGVDPGGRPSVWERATDAAALIISERGLGALTLERVAENAECSVPSLHTVFGGRDGMLAAVFERHGPVIELEELAAELPESLEETVRALHRIFIRAFQREPRVVAGLLSEVMARPKAPVAEMSRTTFPRMFRVFSELLLPHVHAGRLRDLPIPLLVQQLIGPLMAHLMLRPTLEPVVPGGLPPVDFASEEFVRMYLRAVAVEPPSESTRISP